MNDTDSSTEIVPYKEKQLPQKSYDCFLDYTSFDDAQRRAQSLASSGLIPDIYKGRDNIGNVLVALNLARRLNTDVLAVFQNVHNVKGQIGLSGKFIHALLDHCGYFSPLDFKFEYDANKKVIACTVFATDYRFDKVRDITLTWEEVVAAGWNRNKGTMPSPWNIYRKLMFIYRTVSYFAKAYAPDVILGMQSVEELNDMKEESESKPRVIRNPITQKDIDKIQPLNPITDDIPKEPFEYDPPPIPDIPDEKEMFPDYDMENETPIVEEKPTKEELENWWDDMRHWQYRKPVEFYLLVLIGFGIAFRRHTAKTHDGIEDYEMGEEQSALYHSLSRKNSGAICAIVDCSDETLTRLKRKFIENCGFLESTWYDFEATYQ